MRARKAAEFLNAPASDRADDAARRSENYAVGYFESWSLESLQGVVDAAEESRSPVILGFNGAFLSGDRGPANDSPSMPPWEEPPPNRRPSHAA